MITTLQTRARAALHAAGLIPKPAPIPPARCGALYTALIARADILNERALEIEMDGLEEYNSEEDDLEGREDEARDAAALAEAEAGEAKRAAEALARGETPAPDDLDAVRAIYYDDHACPVAAAQAWLLLDQSFTHSDLNEYFFWERGADSIARAAARMAQSAHGRLELRKAASLKAPRKRAR